MVSKDLLLINGTAVQEQASADAKFVLVVEDEPLLLLMAGDMVEEAGLLPLFAGNADAAIRILEFGVMTSASFSPTSECRERWMALGSLRPCATGGLRSG